MEEKRVPYLSAFTFVRVVVFLSLWLCSFAAYLVIQLIYNGGQWHLALSAQSFSRFPFGLIGIFPVAVGGGNELWGFVMVSRNWLASAVTGLWVGYLIMAIAFFLPLGKSAAVKWGIALGAVLFLNFLGNWAVFASLDEVGH